MKIKIIALLILLLPFRINAQSIGIEGCINISTDMPEYGIFLINPYGCIEGSVYIQSALRKQILLDVWFMGIGYHWDELSLGLLFGIYKDSYNISSNTIGTYLRYYSKLSSKFYITSTISWIYRLDRGLGSLYNIEQLAWGGAIFSIGILFNNN